MIQKQDGPNPVWIPERDGQRVKKRSREASRGQRSNGLVSGRIVGWVGRWGEGEKAAGTDI